MKTTIKPKTIAVTGISAAVIFAVTYFLRIPVPIPGGAYINLGDCAIFAAAYLIGAYPAALAAALGSAFADLAAGAPVYIPATFIVKGVMGFLFGIITRKVKSFRRYFAAAVLCGVVMIIGYGVYESLVFSIAYAVSSLPFNLIQAVGSVAVSGVLYKAVEGIRGRISS
jgi:uncharacterized membrane protein